jgi:hypothetical protein
MAWIWLCSRDNNASRPSLDGWRCGAVSRKSFKTKEQAERAGTRHRCAGNWPGYVGGVEVRDIGRKRWPEKRY